MSALASVSCLSERRLAANRANAQLSTGPTTPEGKAKSSVNAVKSGLTGRTVLLPSEDAAAYEEHIARYGKAFQPEGEQEKILVQALADTQWRLHRIPNLEAGLFALGRMRYADLFADESNEQLRTMLLDAHILMVEGKHFKNLHLQESRLLRRYGQDAKELKELQAQRKKEQEEKQQKSSDAATDASSARENGFEFSKRSAEPVNVEGKRNSAAETAKELSSSTLKATAHTGS